jgi:hypothetical protein
MSMAVAVDPGHPGTAYIGTNTGGPNYHGGPGLWKTADCGSTWVHIDTGRNAANLDSGSQWRILVNATTQMMFTTSGYGGGGFYKSSDGGVNWDEITPTATGVPHFVQDFSVDPADANHFVLTFHDNCSGGLPGGCLAETKDGGTTWRIFGGPLSGWSEGAGPITLGPTTYLHASSAGLSYTKDGGGSWEKLSTANTSCSGYTASDGSLLLCTDNGIVKSQNGHDWTAIAKTPKCTVLGADDDSLFVAYQNDYSGHPIWQAPLSSLSMWTNVAAAQMAQGANHFDYDSAHGVLYVSTFTAGLWRVRTR